MISHTMKTFYTSDRDIFICIFTTACQMSVSRQSVYSTFLYAIYQTLILILSCQGLPNNLIYSGFPSGSLYAQLIPQGMVRAPTILS